MIDFKEYLTKYRDIIDKEVAGYFYPIDIIMLYGALQRLQQYQVGNVCEIGIAKGKSAICLSDFKKENETLYLFDNFFETDRQIAEDNIKKFGNYKNISWHVVDTTTLKPSDLTFSDKLRLLHIDGCHEHWAVLNDLTVFSQHMHDHGIIVMDDFNDYEYPGVNSAVHEFCLANYNVNNWRVFAVGDNKAYLCQKQYCHIYEKDMLEFMTVFNRVPERPFDIKMCLRQIYDINALLCDAREVWSIERIEQSFHKKLMG